MTKMELSKVDLEFVGLQDVIATPKAYNEASIGQRFYG
jgi:hypothetical protein